MTTFFLTHPACLLHRLNSGHPECPARLESILGAVGDDPELAGLVRKTASQATVEDLELAHDAAYIESVLALVPQAGLNFLDNDTLLCPDSGVAALLAAGAVLDAVSAVMNKEAQNAFCAVRPPGHHAHAGKGGGFCLFNNVAIGARAALRRHGLSRVAVVDFDVHHGDGTQDIAWNDPGFFYASTHQFPLFPGSGTEEEKGAFDNIVNVPLQALSGGAAARKALAERIMPRLDAFAPEMVFVSAGFDAHREDPLGGLGWTDEDYTFMMESLLDAADRHCGGRLVVVLEGGYNTEALGRCVVACLRVMKQRGERGE